MSIPLQPELYRLSEDETVFFKSQTGIERDEELKTHIFTVQAEAYKAGLGPHQGSCELNCRSLFFQIRPYPCTVMLGISKYPSYQRFLAIGREREGAIYVEIGCCFGNGARKAVADGFPVHQIIATDLHSDFWRLGHKLFKSTPDSFPARFIAADILDFKDSSENSAYTAISEVQTLAQLRGSVSAIHAAAFFHLFDEEQQLQIGKTMAILLSSTPGSIIFGTHIGLPTKGYREAPIIRVGRTRSMFCHSPETWRSLWDGVIFLKGTVDLPDKSGAKFCILVWCITVR
ncbi:hypothetical protein EDD18DRAFT_1309768 [Armillaria luteobubalina]|uniref:Methyltransferase domain-containing protein n=1 Tax=Armillaria luteobubalina TaxID=153913 RepID=A0AA39Q6B4_9AGAR|nr:hypothetical protein EDD18DRAFT_1309768 [Armillaria luteobubalina]